MTCRAWAFENDGSQNFTARSLDPSASLGQFVDLDRDGDLDRIATTGSGSTSRVVWYRNDGAQSHGPLPIASEAEAFINVADIDNDGDFDILTQRTGLSGRLSWYENDGTPAVGTWAQRTVTNDFSSSAAYTADIDGDGDIDIITASNQAARLIWYENDHTALTFTPHTIDNSINIPTLLVVGDVDGDGDLDLLAATNFSKTVIWYRNLGTASQGDYDRNGHVDGADFLLWQRQLGSDASPAGSGADGDGNEKVGAEDLIVWRKNVPTTLAAAVKAFGTDAAAISRAASGVAPILSLQLVASPLAPQRVVFGPPRRSMYAAPVSIAADDDLARFTGLDKSATCATSARVVPAQSGTHEFQDLADAAFADVDETDDLFSTRIDATLAP